MDRVRPLGPGEQIENQSLRELTVEQAFAPLRVADEEMARLCLAGVWLLYDGLDESHTISQSVETSSGSYWHGIMHRREPDYGNAKYWFRRVGRHSVFEPLHAAARDLAKQAEPSDASRRISAMTSWGPFVFIDLCEQAASGGPGANLCREIAAREWELLFYDCFRHAVKIK